MFHSCHVTLRKGDPLNFLDVHRLGQVSAHQPCAPHVNWLIMIYNLMFFGLWQLMLHIYI